MIDPDVAKRRLHIQHLVGASFEKPGEAVGWFGAVQAQDYAGAKWALGLRLHGANDADIDQAFADGTLLRTHVMRPTWHFVTPADIRWLLNLTAPRVRATMAYMNRRLEVDEALFARSSEIIVGALQGGRQLTRVELGSALTTAGINTQGLRMGHLMMRAELDAVVCSGPRRGKQFTYALLDERAPQSRPQAGIMQRDEALAELTRRYYTGHGPATPRDFAWWSGLTVADAKAGLEMAGPHLTREVIGGQTYWFSPPDRSIPPAAGSPLPALLLPTYDEFLVGFAAFDESRRGGREATKNGVFDPPILIGGQVAGTWRRTFKQGAVIVELAPFEPLADADGEAIQAAVERYGQFLGMPVLLSR